MLEVTGAEFKVQGSRFKVQGSKLRVKSWGDGLREPQPDRGGEWEGCLEWKSGLELEFQSSRLRVGS